MEGLILLKRNSGSRGNMGMILSIGVVVVMMMSNSILKGWSRKILMHKLGDSEYGWNQNTNYTIWSSSHHFLVGDWLYFGFDKRYYNVLEVNETSYENCNDRGFIKNVTRGGRDVFELTEARPYFFISGGGYCFHGMRVAVYVYVAAAPPIPGPATPRPALAPAPFGHQAQTLAPFHAQKNNSPKSKSMNHQIQMTLFVMLFINLFWIIFG